MILPLIGELLARVGRHPAVEEVLEGVRRGKGDLHLAGLSDPAKALVVAHAAVSLGRPVFWLVESNARADGLAELLRFFYRVLSRKPAGVETLPAYDVLPYQGLSPHPEVAAERAVALWRMASGLAAAVVAPVAGAQMRLREASHYTGLARKLERDQEVELQELLGHLAAVGYQRTEMVEMPGQFAVRGGIVDVFSPEAMRPVRIELFGDTVESLREFDPQTQRSVAPVERVTLLPLSEHLRGGEFDGAPGWEFAAMRREQPQHTLFELCGRPLVVGDELEALARASAQFHDRLAEAYARAVEKDPEAAPPQAFYLDDAAWTETLRGQDCVWLERLAVQTPGCSPLVVRTQPTVRYRGNVAAFMAEARGRIDAGEQVIVAAASTGELERLAGLCQEYGVAYRLGEWEEDATVGRLLQEARAGDVAALTLVKAPLTEGVVFPELNLTLFGTSDLFEMPAVPARPKRKPQAAAFFGDFADLKPGDYVVHVDHGIGQYEGLRQLEIDGSFGEFMLLSYAEQARLYVPLARMDLVQKYRGLEGARPQLDRLGGTVWEARKTRARKAVSDMAEQLLGLYAERKTVEGIGFSSDTAWQREFEDAFEFEETPDQARAIGEVKRDMERRMPMDRLLCGDVGYGKTEVAMRAAFKAVNDSKQVAVLAPTTVLVFQHYETFRQRFAAFPVRVEMLSRFRSAAEQKRILAEVEAGRVDVLIGTHRLLSRDVRFHDLGLLVVDEEQRFGVAHKERLKQLRKNVDVLTLTATPIPRTLHMSLVGLRDMSVIETPPKDRLAIQTVVAPFSERLVQQAIEEELARQGQVYFVHNRVESIDSLAAMAQRLVPQARIVVGHGQMSERELERVMLKFIRHEADVLVSTTIVENGLDIPRVNTIVINRADRFGLAELYQLRGRVGRSSQRAYAYLLVPPGEALSPLARRRLAALKEFSELGSGFKIAALDLELRGAGNLLGRQQHGHINAIGFDLYCRMLERAVAERQGEAGPPERRATLNLGLEIRIPADYIPNENLRLRTYRRIAEVASEAGRDEVWGELTDRFGPPPPAVANLLDYALLKSLAERLQVAAIERRGDRVAVKFYESTPVRPEQIVHVVRSQQGLRLDPSGVLWMEWKRGEDRLTETLRKLLLPLQA